MARLRLLFAKLLYGRSLPQQAPACSLMAMCLAVPGKILSISGEEPLARTGKIDFGGIHKEVSLAYLPEATVGDYVIVHVGFAISRLDEEEALKVFEYLREMDELAALEDKERRPDAAPNLPRAG